jgi:hypothetical protein
VLSGRRKTDYTRITMTTTYSNKLQILSDLWMDYRNDEDFSDFVEYNDLGLPLAYAVSNNIVETTPIVEQFVEVGESR